MNPWLAVFRPNPHARLRLFCLPYAGGSARFYRTWDSELTGKIEVCPVQLPGRDARLREAPVRRLGSMVDALADALSPHLTLPFALFGHSMGALLSFELARKLRSLNRPQPVHLFLSGRIAPHLPDPRPPIHELPDDKFIEELRQLNGTPKEVIESRELMQLMMPALRADFELTETYVHQNDSPLPCSASAYGGLEDPEADREGLAGWREHVSGQLKVRMFPGDHFFLLTARAFFMEALNRDILEALNTLA